jgi:RNA polymerase alpha subunit
MSSDMRMTGGISEPVASVDYHEGERSYSANLAIRVQDLFLSVRASNVLKHAEIKYVGDLVQLTEDRLRKVPNCGRKTITEIREKLAELGLGFGMAVDRRNQTITPQSSSPVAGPENKTTLANLDAKIRTRLYLRIDEIGLSQRARNVLRAADIEFVGDLVGKTEYDLSRLASCGRLTRSEIINKLNELGLRLQFFVSDWNAAAARAIREEQDSDSGSAIASLRRSLHTIPPSDFLEDELRSIFISVANKRDTDMAIKQLGWSGKGQRTLESVGQEYSVTRERVRQIVARDTRKIREEFVKTPRLDEALSAIRDCCPTTGAGLAGELRARGISKGDFDPSGLESACNVFQRNFGLERVNIGREAVYALGKQSKQIVELFRLCRRLTGSQGCANFDAVCDELRISEAERYRFRELASLESVCEWLDGDRRWLFATGRTRNRLTNLVAKVLSVSPHVNLTELRKAVARSRRLAVCPPVAVLGKFVGRFGLATVSDGRVSAVAEFASTIAAGGAESVLVSVLETHGPVLGRDRFQELCIAAGMNPITFGIYLSNSPIIARVRRGIYSLVGADIPPGVVEELEREVAASRKPAEWGWSPRGTLWYALPVTPTVLAAGSVAVAPFVADIADGEWKPCFDGRELDGSVKCNNRFLWGLRRPLINAGAEPGDVSVLEFDVSKRTVNITLGGEELADMWETGDIDTPAPEQADVDSTDQFDESSDD